MDMGRLVKILQGHEGRVTKGGRHVPYKDSKGKLTLGYGHLLERGVTESVALLLLQEDIQEVINELRRKWWWFDELDAVRQEVVINMAFNMGVPRFATFKRTIGYISEGEYVLASQEMLDSKWAREDVGPSRSSQLSRMMANGEYEEI